MYDDVWWGIEEEGKQSVRSWVLYVLVLLSELSCLVARSFGGYGMDEWCFAVLVLCCDVAGELLCVALCVRCVMVVALLLFRVKLDKMYLDT